MILLRGKAKCVEESEENKTKYFANQTNRRVKLNRLLREIK